MFHQGGLISRGALLSHDSKLIIAPSASQLKILSAITGEVVGVLKGHAAEVTCAALNPNKRNEVYSASKDGSIKLWDYTTQECIKTLSVRETVRGMVFSSDLPVVYLSIDWRDGAAGRVITYDLLKGKAGRTAMKTSRSRPLSCCGTCTGTNRAQTFAATFDKHSLFVWRVGEEIHQPLNLHHTKPYTCVAISADETMIAAGDASGRIQIWRNFAAHVPAVKRGEGAASGPGSGKHHVDPSLLQPTTVHWHSSAVGCLAFSPDGTYLLSGGRESVLVIWQVETGGQNFLPRLGGPLTSILPSPKGPSKYLISQADNTLRVINTASMKVESSIFGLRPLPRGLPPRAAASGATVLQPGTGHLLVPSENAELQVFDTVHNRHVSLFKIINRNHVSMQERGFSYNLMPSYEAPPQPFVSHSAFTCSGACLVTADIRPDSGPYGSSQSCLKFWDLTNASTRTGLDAPFTLNTCVDDPHGSHGYVSSVSCHPVVDMAVTTSAEACEFRLWVKLPGQRKPGGKVQDPTHWVCRSMGGYKGLPITASAFSTDGSILALAAGSKVTLWDPMTCRLAAVLSSTPEQHVSGLQLTRISFISSSPYIVGISDGFVNVWNILTTSMQWSLDLPTCALAVDPVYSSFAVVVPIAATLKAQLTQSSVLSGLEEQRDTPPSSSEIATSVTPSTTDASVAASGGGAVPPPKTSISSSSPPVAGSIPTSHVLVFDVQSCKPRLHSICPGTLAPALLYIPPGMPQHTEMCQGLPSQISPLLLVTEDRRYSYLTSPGAVGTTKAVTSSTARPSLEERIATGPSAFEDAFGRLGVSTTASSGEAVAMEIDAQVGRSIRPWRNLFDAPSHALPSASSLAQSYLLLVTASET
ncbi:hypothetical protein CEUSTIGMA_g450.t1 [Chlamydomonas eustigma]|uniref:WD repeat-containing protein 75 second beta-propeller domain-containing protein n=1 Tax=Chlamydomonas eustigma TaxID=1157962 RepID=A0A250WQ96_9CHLO|nr:hypothetical protein CEUSTIGMA_g450.t1 [Chlamydomonas eustigma]|eukprot:GAX72998.1 hypothetical protein CEUSTIGMA_g450.t1 [Chlamydomonas eustigma]